MDRNIVCLGPGHRRAPGLAVAALGELSPALLLALCVLNSLGDSPSLSVLKILTALLGDIMIFLTRDILISCLLLLATVLDRLLGALMRAHRLVNSLLHVPSPGIAFSALGSTLGKEEVSLICSAA